jgi:arginine decarboxylase
VTAVHFGNRVPETYFRTQGSGQSDITDHAGSYHLALRAAGIERANIITYSSILPEACIEVPRDRYQLTHGEVMETIVAAGTCRYGESVTAALGTGWLVDRTTGRRGGGLVAEYSGSLDPEHAVPHVRSMLDELWRAGLEESWLLDEVEVRTESISPTKMYGTALVALCFTSYRVEVYP